MEALTKSKHRFEIRVSENNALVRVWFVICYLSVGLNKEEQIKRDYEVM